MALYGIREEKYSKNEIGHSEESYHTIAKSECSGLWGAAIPGAMIKLLGYNTTGK